MVLVPKEADSPTERLCSAIISFELTVICTSMVNKGDEKGRF